MQAPGVPPHSRNERCTLEKHSNGLRDGQFATHDAGCTPNDTVIRIVYPEYFSRYLVIPPSMTVRRTKLIELRLKNSRVGLRAARDRPAEREPAGPVPACYGTGRGVISV